MPGEYQPQMRRFGDYAATRDAVFGNALSAVQALPAAENTRYRLSLSDVGYTPNWAPPTPADHKQALLSGRTLSRRMVGTFNLHDKATGQLVDSRRMTVASVPTLTDQGVFVLEGSGNPVSHQLRLLPGIYVRKKQSGEVAAHVNVAGRGVQHHVVLDPETGVFKTHIGQSELPTLTLLRLLGAKDAEVKALWGHELFAANSKADRPHHVDKYWEKMGPPGKVPDGTDKAAVLADRVSRYRLDPWVMKQTLGKAYETYGKQPLLDVTGKMLAVARGKAEPDDRDHLAFSRVFGPEHLIAERVGKGAGLISSALWGVTNTGSLKRLPPNILTPAIKHLFTKSGLSGQAEGVSSAEFIDHGARLTKLGEGGIGRSADSIPMSARDVGASQFPFIDLSRTSEAESVGADLRVAFGTRLGTDGRIYAPLLDRRSNRLVFRSPRDVAEKTVAFPGAMNQPDPVVPVVRNGKLTYAPRHEVDYVVPSMEQSFSPLANLIPFKGAMKAHRTSMGSRFIAQALPLAEPEAPLVQNQVPGQPGKSFAALYGRHMGAVFAAPDKAGVVQQVTPDAITVRYADGTIETKNLYHHLPSGRKAGLHTTPVVAPGQEVAPGQILARSNYTDHNGVAAYGKNLRVAYMSDRGRVYEDAMTISESAAKKMTSDHYYTHSLTPDPHTTLGKTAYVAGFPGRHTLDTLKGIGDDGVVKPGTIVRPNDPLILATRRKPTPFGRLSRSGKAGLSDASVLWEHDEPGVVTDVVHGSYGPNVVVRTQVPLKTGDKVSNLYGGKGIATVIPDHQMPIGEDGKPMEVIMSSLGLISRANPAQYYESLLGKLAAKTGKPYVVSDFGDDGDPTSLIDRIEAEAARHGVHHKEDLTDPQTGNRIPGVATGVSYLLKLHHIASAKVKGRGLGGYDESGQPLRGQSGKAMRASLGDTNALLSYGATNNIHDAHALRGQGNDLFWLGYMSGFPPMTPHVSSAFEHFLSELQAAGVNPVRKDGRYHLMALTDKDVHKMAGDRVVQNGETLDFGRNGEPYPGGLFDTKTFGAVDSKTQWAKIPLPEPMVNPVMEDPARRLLGLTEKQFRETIAGRHHLATGTGPKAIADALAGIDVQKELVRTRQQAASSRKTVRDEANRKLIYLKGLEKTGQNPKDWVLSAVPVLPPAFRPVSAGGGGRCFRGTTLVWTESGMVPIKTIVSERRACRVWSYDFDHAEFVLRPVVGWHKNSVAGLIGVRTPLPRGRLATVAGMFRPEILWGTPNHQVYTADGTKHALADVNCLLAARETLSYVQQQLLYGSLLGDGHVAKNGSYYCCHGEDQYEYARLKSDILANINPKGLRARPYKTPYGERKVGGGFSTIIHADLLDARRECYDGMNGTKTVTQKWLDRVGQLGLAVWYFDDGEAYYETSVPIVKFSTQCFDRAGIYLLQSWLQERWGISSGLMRWQAHYAGRDQGWQIVVRGNDALALLELVAPFAPSCLRYKLLLDEPVALRCEQCDTRLPVRLHRKPICNVCVARLPKTAATSGLRNSRARAGNVHESEQEVVDAKWRRRVALAGSKLSELTTVPPAQLRLESVPVRGLSVDGNGRRCRTAYDITVSDTHNYFANGYLVGNSGSNNVITSDINLLYSELLQAIQAHKELAPHVADTGDEKLNVYDAMKAVVGLGDPVGAKNQERGVKGVLARLLGESSKSSYMQQRLLGTPTNLSGRAQALPNPDLNMDEVGIPESMAWEVYHPFIVRRLVQRGMGRVDAARAVADQSKMAREAMVDEMGVRPVLMTRYPVLHRFGVQAQWPKLMAGDGLHINPMVTRMFNGDFDGDSYTVQVPLSDAAVKEAQEKLLPSKNLFTPTRFDSLGFTHGMEFLQGLHYLSTADAGNPPVEFRTRAEALRAYRSGKIGADTKVRILEE